MGLAQGWGGNRLTVGGEDVKVARRLPVGLAGVPDEFFVAGKFHQAADLGIGIGGGKDEVAIGQNPKIAEAV